MTKENHPNNGQGAHNHTEPEPDSDSASWQKYFDSDESRTVRDLATRFECSEHTLKYNIKKSRKIPAVQESEKSAYKAKPSDVITFLNADLSIKSVFSANPLGHPVPPKTPVTPPIVPDFRAVENAIVRTDCAFPPPNDPLAHPEPSNVAIPPEKPASRLDEPQAVPLTTPEVGVPEKPDETQPRPPLAAHAPTPQTDLPTPDAFQMEPKRRTRRGRRRGQTVSPPSSGMLRLEKLAALSPAERTRFAGVIHELMGVILNS